MKSYITEIDYCWPMTADYRFSIYLLHIGMDYSCYFPFPSHDGENKKRIYAKRSSLHRRENGHKNVPGERVPRT